MQIGQLFCWNNFPHHRDGDQKFRLFILLGKSNIFFPPVVVYVVTLTSQLQHYDSDENRENNTIVRFKKGECGLDKPSVADLDYDIYDFVLESEIENNNDIKLIDLVPDLKLKLFYEKLLLTNVSKIMKIDIHQCLNSIGVTGLKRP